MSAQTIEPGIGGGCPVTVYDGPYAFRCNKGADVGICSTHGPFSDRGDGMDVASIRARHQGRTWHADGSIAGPDHCDACALLLALDRTRDEVEKSRAPAGREDSR